MSAFIDIVAAIIAVLIVISYPILCLLLGFAVGEFYLHKHEKKDTSKEVQE